MLCSSLVKQAQAQYAKFGKVNFTDSMNITPLLNEVESPWCNEDTLILCPVTELDTDLGQSL